jgi:hypothetical protein
MLTICVTYSPNTAFSLDACAQKAGYSHPLLADHDWTGYKLRKEDDGD